MISIRNASFSDFENILTFLKIFLFFSFSCFGNLLKHAQLAVSNRANLTKSMQNFAEKGRNLVYETGYTDCIEIKCHLFVILQIIFPNPRIPHFCPAIAF